MIMNNLIAHNIPPEIICMWKQTEGNSLLPVQELAVKRYGLFDSHNLLIQAPTSSGKTFIGEMAAVHTALRRKKVVYLVPLKALAEEKYNDFKKKYEHYGINVIISTRDHRQHDTEFEDGRFDIAVVVYEKLTQLFVRRPERIEEIELVVADELELLSDTERGGLTDLLLTRIIQSDCRLIGLSAVIGEPEKLAEWMQAKLIKYERRPVELRYGVLHEGVFRYRTYNDYSENVEPMPVNAGDSPQEQLYGALRSFAERGESCIVFVKSKHEARIGAEILANEIDAPAAENSIEKLRGLDETRARQTLTKTLQTGIAYHSADLTPEERSIIENGFRAGEIQVLVSTSTLAVGLNMPARNVFITTDKWQYDARFGMPWKAPILRSEYENMGGRAGRLGAGHDYGRSILLASTAFEHETLWRTYIEGESEGILPRLTQDALEDHVVHLVASKQCRTRRQLVAFLENTLSGQWIWSQQYTLDEVENTINKALHHACDNGFLANADQLHLEATPFGYALASKGLRIDTAKALEQWITDSEMRDWDPAELILAAALTVDGRMYAVMLTAVEHESGEYPRQWAQYLKNSDAHTLHDTHFDATPFFEDVRALKVTLMLLDWIDQDSIIDIEEKFNTSAGQILAASRQISWLLDAAAALAATVGAADAFVERIRTLAIRVQRGLREEGYALGCFAEPGISRTALTALVAHNLHSLQALAEVPAGILEQWMPKEAAQALKEKAIELLSDERSHPQAQMHLPDVAALIFNDETPSRIHVRGLEVQLQEKQYILIRLLAESPGKCIRYETIYEALWGDVIVENNQMHYQKRKLLDALCEVSSDCEKWIQTIPKQGYLLNLLPGQIRFQNEFVAT